MENEDIKFSVKESFNHLNKHCAFESNAFLGSEKFSQEMCNLMLALALFCNDLKDIMIYNKLVNDAKPEDSQQLTPEVGQFSGMQLFLERLYIGKIVELKTLILKNKQVISSKEFSKLISTLPKKKRKYWQELLDTLLNNKEASNAQFKNILAIIRNETSFHYVPKSLFKGYKEKFLDRENEPFISLGGTIKETRFYFADACFQALVAKEVSTRNSDYVNKLKDLLENMFNSIYLLVIKFIQLKSTWHEPTQTKASDLVL